MSPQTQSCRQWVGQLVDHATSSTIYRNAASDPKVIMYGAALFAIFAWLLFRATKLLKETKTSRSVTPDLEKPAARSFKAPLREPGGKFVFLSARST